MKKELLKKLGIRLEMDIPINELLSENFNAKLYSLNRSQAEKIHILRDIITEYNHTIPIDDKIQIKGSEDAVKVLRPLYKGFGHEECWILLVNRCNRILAREQMSKGGCSETVIDYRLIIRKALEHSASGIILSHNHPSNAPEPSIQDIQTTKEFKKACKIFGITRL